MIFTPDSIKKQEFNKSMRGFDKDEVHAFLEKLSTEFETLLNENETIGKELNEAKHQLENFLQNANKIELLQKESAENAEQLMLKAQNKAGEILRLAEEKSAELLKKSREEAEKLKSTVQLLREEKEVLITKLKTVINYQSHLLEMKIEEADEKVKEAEKPEQALSIDVDINEIVKKIL